MIRLRHSLILLIGGFALAVGSCGREGPTAPSTEHPTSPRILRLTAPAPTIVFGPATYTRDTGKPRTDTASFGARAGDTLTFVLTSGAAQGLNATVDVNGIRLFSSTGGRGLPDTIRAVAHASNTLRVWMAGKPGSSLRIVATVPGPPVPVETRVLSVLYERSVVGAGPSGDTALALGSRVHYAFALNRGFQRLRVVVDGQMAPDSGTLTMDRAHWIAATADTVISLDPTERPLAQLLRTVLTSATPREDWRAYQAAVEEAAAGWGDQAEVHLARVQTVTIDPVTDLANLVRLDSALAGMVTPIELPPAFSSLRAGADQAAMRVSASSRRAVALDTLGDREATQILLVNGINTTRPDADRSATLLGRKVALEGRFLGPRTKLSAVYNSSLFNLSALHRLASACFDSFLTSARSRNLTLIQTLFTSPSYFACLAQAGAQSNDISEMLRWAQDAISPAPQVSSEVDGLALLMRSYQNDSLRHVLVIAHSEGSLLTQLAARRLKDVYGFNEGRTPRCVGTISVAGVGTNAWPLSDRRSRFVVAKHDLVTTLPGDLRNWRPTTEDWDTRQLDSLLVAIERGGPGFEHLRSVLLVGAKVLGGRQIHRLDRYLRSADIWPIIYGDLEELHNTCDSYTVLVSPPTATVQLFGTAAFSATWYAGDGQLLTTSDSVDWSVDSAFASVTRGGVFVAGGAPRTVALRARVRNAVGTASITISDDSVRALYEPPVVTVTETALKLGPYPPGPTTCDVQALTITAAAMPGASITSVELYVRSTITLEEDHWPVPLDTEFIWRTISCTIGGLPGPGNSLYNAYRVVVTDSHGLVTEKSSPNP